jgi:hypothetical protein
MAPLLDWVFPDLTAQFAHPGDFPGRVPLGVYRIGDLWFATLPGEFTTVMGRRVAQGVAGCTPATPDSVNLIGLANEYVSYFSTPEEYEAQDYEGASTLYGPDSGPWIARNLASLAATVSQRAERASPLCFGYTVRPRRTFGFGDLGEPPLRHDDGLPSVLVDDKHHLLRNLPHVEWMEPRIELAALRTGCRSAVPFLRVRNERGDIAADSNGLQLVTVALRADSDHVLWTAIWLIDLGVPTGTYTCFAIHADGEHEIGRCCVPP